MIFRVLEGLGYQRGKMAEEIILLIERAGRKQFSNFLELFIKRSEIPMKEIRLKIPKSTFYDFILTKIYKINLAIKTINPDMESFIIPVLSNRNGKIIQCFRRNCNIEISNEDPNFFYLKLKKESKDAV